MSSRDYNYDEQGQFFPYFILTLTGLVTLPLSYTLFRPSNGLENTAPRIKSDFKPEHDDLIRWQKQKLIRKARGVKRLITVAAGYAIMGWMVYLIIVTAQTVPKIWDPYDILDISRSADEKTITRHYKRLSLRLHPDKARPDPAKNETIEILNDRFVELTKAYKALTDEEIRNNYIQYGHPDGKQSFSIGIALPKFIVTEGNGKHVLLLYCLLLGVLLPYIVGKWWYGSQRYTKEGVLVTSAGRMFREYQDGLARGDIITAISSGEEYQQMLQGDRAEAGLSRIENKILAATEDESHRTVAGLSSGDRKKLTQLENPTRRKALALLWAYLGRTDLDDRSLNNEKFEAAPTAITLNDAFTVIALAFGSLSSIQGSFMTSQQLIQAVPPGASSLLQLPHFNSKIVRSIEGDGSKSHVNIQQYMQLPEERRRQLTVGSNLLSPSEYMTAISVARQIPALDINTAFFKVVGEKVITPSSLVQLVIKARFIPPGFTDVPVISEADLEEPDPSDDDLDATGGRRGSKASKFTTKGGAEQGPVQPPLAHAPYFVRDHSPRWYVFLADAKQGRIAVPPFTFTTFENPIFNEDGKPTFNIQTMKMQFQAPPQVGSFHFMLYVICDSYIGFDTSREITLQVEDFAKAAAVEEEDDISEPDEDSLAGQMQALKTGVLPSSKKKRRTKAGEEESSEEEESDTEGDVDDTSDTDTETDTDEE